MKTKAKGSRLEYKTIRYLEKRGYKCTRAAGSLGEFDLIAINRFNVRLIQVKANKWVYGKEKRILQKFICPSCCTKEMWRWDDYARQPRVRVL